MYICTNTCMHINTDDIKHGLDDKQILNMSINRELNESTPFSRGGKKGEIGNVLLCQLEIDYVASRIFDIKQNCISILNPCSAITLHRSSLIYSRIFGIFLLCILHFALCIFQPKEYVPTTLVLRYV